MRITPSLCCLLIFFFVNEAKSQISFTLSPQACQNQSLSLSASSGTISALGYTWTSIPNGAVLSSANSSLSTLSFTNSGTYTISLIASSNSGTTASSKIIEVIPFPISALSALSQTICAPFSASLSVTGANGYTWSPTAGLFNIGNITVLASPSISSTYTVFGNSFSCGTSSLSFNVIVGTYPILSFSSSAYAVCPGKTAVLAGFGAISYNWLGITSTINVTQPTVEVGAGNYTLVGSNGGSCTNTLSTIIIMLMSCTGLEEAEANEKNFRLFPNPVKEKVFIQSKKSISSKIEVLDVLSKVIFSESVVLNETETKEIDLSNLPCGLYYLRVQALDGSSQIIKLLKE